MSDVVKARPRAFTLIELLLALAILGIILVIAGPLLSDALSRNDLDGYVDRAVAALHEARSSTMSGKANARYGVHFEKTKFGFYEGTFASQAETVTTEFSNYVTITAVTFTPVCSFDPAPGNCNVDYASHKGIPAVTGSIVFTATNGETRKLCLNAAGLIDRVSSSGAACPP